MRANILRLDRRYQGVFANNAAGQGSYLSVASSSAFDVASPSKFTIRARFRPTASNVNNGLVNRGALGSTQGDWSLTVGTGTNMRPVFRVNNGTSPLATATADLVVGAWYLIEASYDSSLGSANLKMFINGVLDNTQNYTTVISNNSNPIVVGTYFAAGSNNMIGELAEVEFSNGVIRHTATYTPPTILTPDSSTTFLWNFQTKSVGTDIGPSGRHGAQVGTYPFNDILYRQVR